MQTHPTNYDTIIAGEHWFETQVTIDGNAVGETSIMSINRSRPGMPENKPSVGGALSATLNLTILKPSFSIPKLATIVVKVRARNSSQTSGWLNQGTFYVDTRKHNESAGSLGTIQITAYDSMAKAEADYPSVNHSWPYLDKSVVAEIATAIGVTVDSRTNSFLTSGYMIDLPLGYTMRETLEHIAAAYGGNFVITADNKLLFVPLYGFEPRVIGNYLADTNGDALVFGNEGWCILV